MCVSVCYLCVGQVVAAVGMSVAEAGSDHPHLSQGVKLAQTAAGHAGN